MLLQAVGAKDDPSSGGRQMPSHWGNPRLNIVTGPPPQARNCAMPWAPPRLLFITKQFPKALAQAKNAPLGGTSRHAADEIVYRVRRRWRHQRRRILRSAERRVLRKLPVLFLIEDNGYAISVPVEFQTAGGNISKLVRNFPGLHVEECDGTDPLES